MAVDFSKFQQKLSEKEIKDLEEKHQTSGNYRDIPSGVYPVALNKMELTKSKFNGADQLAIDFKVTDGEFSGQHIFVNGTFDDHFAHGVGQMARLLSEMTGGEVPRETMLYNLTQPISNVSSFILDLYQAIAGKLEYDLDLDVKTSTKINSYTNKPYVNRFYSIAAVYDV